MSFDIHYHTCNFGTRVTKRNRFTGKMQSVSAADTLTDAERKAVLSLLKKASAVLSDEFGGYEVNLPDGGSANVSPIEESPHAWAGLLVCLRALTSSMAALLWGLCRAGNMAAVPVLKDGRDLVLVASEEHRGRAMARWSSPKVVVSPDEFYRLLGGNCPPPITAHTQVDEIMPHILSRAVSADGEFVLDLKADATEVRDYITSRVAAFDPRSNDGPGKLPVVKMVYAGFEYDQAGWFALVFDCRHNAHHDGEWTGHLKANMLARPGWSTARERNTERLIRIRDEDGSVLALPVASEFGPLIGRMLVKVLQGAKRDGVFDRLPQAEGFKLGLEEFNGSLGWDSEAGFGGPAE